MKNHPNIALSFITLVVAMAWFMVAAPAAAESAPDSAATPASATAPAETGTVENTAAGALQACEHGCADYPEGAEICIDKKQYRCSKQGWRLTDRACAEPPVIQK